MPWLISYLSHDQVDLADTSRRPCWSVGRTHARRVYHDDARTNKSHMSILSLECSLVMVRDDETGTYDHSH